MSNPQQLVQKLWNYCNILRDDGLSCGDYVEQLTFLLFLKMADEQSRPPFNKPSPIPKGKDWLPCWPRMGTSWRFITAIRWRNSASGREGEARLRAWGQRHERWRGGEIPRASR